MLGAGSIDAVHAHLPPWSALILALFTQVGAIWFAATLLIVAYVRGHRRMSVTIAGLLVAGTGTWLAFKVIHPVPRPEQLLLAPGDLPAVVGAVYDVAIVDMGHRFPSGHAVTSTIFYGSLALRLSRPRTAVRLPAAVLVIVVVGFTRIALGVHLPVDVIGGIVIGASIIAIHHLVVRATAGRFDHLAVQLGLIGAVGCAIVHLAIGMLDPLVVVLLGVSVGLWYGVRAGFVAKSGVE